MFRQKRFGETKRGRLCQSLPTPAQLRFPPVDGLSVRGDFDGGALSSDFGPMILKRVLKRLRAAWPKTHSWPQSFRVVLKAEVMSLGDNPRFVVTSLNQPTPNSSIGSCIVPAVRMKTSSCLDYLLKYSGIRPSVWFMNHSG